VAFEASSFVGYVWLLRRIGRPLTWRAAWQITLAGVAAARVVTVAGAGGIAVTIDGLRRSGLSTREAAERQAVDLAVLYGVFFSLTFLDGLVLLLSGHTLALSAAPAALAVIVIALGLAMAPSSAHSSAGSGGPAAGSAPSRRSWRPVYEARAS
jgi:hypothetical protein